MLVNVQDCGESISKLLDSEKDLQHLQVSAFTILVCNSE